MSGDVAAGGDDGPDRVLEGPSYPNGVKGLAIAAVLLIVGLGSGPAGRQAAALPPAAQLLVLAAIAVLFVHLWGLLRSRTRIDAKAICQTGPWRREVALTDVVQLRLMRVRGLEAIVTPRLLVRTGAARLSVFTTGDARVLAAFERLAHAARGAAAPSA